MKLNHIRANYFEVIQYKMELKLIIRSVNVAFLILFSFQLQAQNKISYEDNRSDATLRKLFFIDTLQNKVLYSFSPSEKCPYWNLPYPEINNAIPNCKSTKRFDLKDINSISRIDIPGLIALNGGNLILNPGWATTGHLCYLTTNHQWVFIYSSIYIYNYDEEWSGYAMEIQIFTSTGTLYRTITSTDGEISDVRLTDNCLYLVYGNLNVDSYILGSRNYSTRIVDLNSMETKFEFKDKTLNQMTLYNRVFDNYIFIMSENEDDYKDTNSKGDGHIICLDMLKGVEYTGQVEHGLIYNMKSITKEGIIFGIKNNQDSNIVLKHFSNFQKDKIE